MRYVVPWLRDWSFRDGRVTRSFDEWRLEIGFLEAYWRLGLRFQTEGYQRLWDHLASQPSDGEGPELPDLFFGEVGGLTDWQFEQVHLAAVVRDAVTIFDLYVEGALAEALAHQLGRQVELPERSPSWGGLKKAWRLLAKVNLDDHGVREVRERRNWLTHQRGQIRTERQRLEHEPDAFDWPEEALRLTDDMVRLDLATLAEAAVRLDVDAYRLGWGPAQDNSGADAEALECLMNWRKGLPEEVDPIS